MKKRISKDPKKSVLPGRGWNLLFAQAIFTVICSLINMELFIHIFMFFFFCGVALHIF